MLTQNALKQKLAQGLQVMGMLNSVPTPWLVEMLGYAGYDFVILDMEHLSTNPETLEHMIRAAECAGITPLVRVPGVQPDTIQRALDAGAMGIVVPRVNDAEEARKIVRASKYHPLGRRGITGGRTTGFGTLALGDYLAQANTETLVVLMIESRAGVDNLDEILAVDGVDWILEGALDLSHDYGVAPDFMHPEVQETIALMAEKCRRSGVHFCAIPRQEGQFQAWTEQGVQAFLLGEDRGILFKRLKQYRENFKVETVD